MFLIMMVPFFLVRVVNDGVADWPTFPVDFGLVINDVRY